MKITKRWNIVATVGTYKKDGELKKKFQKVGTLVETPTGPVVFLDSCFNPAGVDRPDGQQSVLLSCYESDTERVSGREYFPSSADDDDDAPF